MKATNIFWLLFCFKINYMIQVFNVIITGKTKENYLNLTKEEKAEWIKTHTAQKNDEQIAIFLASANYPEVKGCLSCGELNNKIIRHGNISKTDAVEASKSDGSIMVKKSSTGDSDKRPSKTKRRKNK